MAEKNDEAASLWKEYTKKNNAKFAPRFALIVAVVFGLILLAIGVWIVV